MKSFAIFILCLSFYYSLPAIASAITYKQQVDGEIIFVHSDKNQNQNQSQFIKEYSGKIILKNNKFYYQTTQIGHLTPLGPVICQSIYSKICTLSFGKKNHNYDHNYNESSNTIYSVALTLTPTLTNENINDNKSQNTKNADFTLEPYIFASPNQDEAGSCLFMALTGAMEIILNKEITQEQRIYEGMSDLSERYLMNASDLASASNNTNTNNDTNNDEKIYNWRTDTIYTYNYFSGALLNRDFRYTTGWYKEIDGELMVAKKGEEGATYGTYYNWINGITDELMKKKIPVPKVARELIFVDTNNDQWNTGVMTDATIKRIKERLTARNSPTLIIYNHYGYWHAVLIVGYDDEKVTEGCSFVFSWRKAMLKEADELIATNDPKKLERANRLKNYVNQVNKSIEQNGGCSTKGVFYVRDSIYTGPTNLMYDYDLSNQGEEAPYSTRIIERSYDWAKYLGNHAYVVYKK
ncbi:MAG: hypothetical protein HQK49_11665 [Oligoflexia bacterium]|nr:hypothetical protein [Oligoflexia bacterium]